MRTKKLSIMGIILVAFIFTFINSGVYAADIVGATVLKVGIVPTSSTLDTDVTVFLDDPTDTYWTGSRYFFISSGLGNQGLAVILTALSMERTVTVRIGGSLDAVPTKGSLINFVYIDE